VGVSDDVAWKVEVGGVDDVWRLVVQVFKVVFAGLLRTSITRLRPRRVKWRRLYAVRILEFEMGSSGYPEDCVVVLRMLRGESVRTRMEFYTYSVYTA